MLHVHRLDVYFIFRACSVYKRVEYFTIHYIIRTVRFSSSAIRAKEDKRKLPGEESNSFRSLHCTYIDMVK